MKATLLNRTKPEFYAEYTRMARDGGADESMIARVIAEDIRVATSLLAGKCPTCGAPSRSYVNRNYQQGFSTISGTWIQYRCSTQSPPGQTNPPGACDFFVDLVEAGA